MEDGDGSMDFGEVYVEPNPCSEIKSLPPGGLFESDSGG